MSNYASGSHNAGMPPLQTVVQLNVYRLREGQFEYLLLKRIDADTNFWQVITEPVPSSATLGDTLRQAAIEQAGLRGFKHLSHESYSYEWYAHGERGRDIVFAAEVSPEAFVTVDRHRYSEYAWLSVDEAIRRLKWDGNRTALRKLDSHLASQMESNPPGQAAQQTAAHQQASTTPTTSPPGQPSTFHTPYGPNVPKRLPDVPPSIASTPGQDVNPGEFFL